MIKIPEDNRQLDIMIAEHVLGYVTRRIKPSWYKYEVILFFEKDHPLVIYSFDENSCNAMMYANGVDEKDGTAQALPFYSTEIQDAWEVCVAMQGDYYFGTGLEGLYSYSSEDAAREICVEALKAVEERKRIAALTPEQLEENRRINVLGD